MHGRPGCRLATPRQHNESQVPELIRCSWPSNPLSIRYHDEEWGLPQHDDRILFEFLFLEGAQAGLSWDTILQKRENYRAAFDGFDAERIARYDRRKVQRLLRNPGIMRNRLKIASAVRNAKAFLKLRKNLVRSTATSGSSLAESRCVNTWRPDAGSSGTHRRSPTP